MYFGDFIRSKREEQGMSLRVLSVMLGVTPSYLSDIERGRRFPPSGQLLKKMYEALGVGDIERYYDLAAEAKNDIPEDIKRGLLANKVLYQEIRRIIDAARKDGKA